MIQRQKMSASRERREHKARLTARTAAAAFAALTVVVMILCADEANARRRYIQERYSPPSSAMAIDLNTGHILYSKNPNELRYPASLTKVMTLYLLFDALRDGKLTMTTKLRVSEYASEQSPTKLDLSPGETISVADAIGAIVTKSANDMAVTVAEALAGSEEEFARLMTQKARTIGMLNTTFRNASGLPNSEQKTTAQDLIILGKSILADHPERCKVFATKYFQYDGEVYMNHNTMLFSYEGMEGMKTGFTSASGFNLLASAHRGDKRILAVVLGGPSAAARNASMRSILDSSWSKAMSQVAAQKAGLLVAASKPKAMAPKPVQAPTPSRMQRLEVIPATFVTKPAPRPQFGTQVTPVRNKPDRISIAILLASIESGLARHRAVADLRPAASDTTTDEPDDNAGRAATRSAGYTPPPPGEIARNETLVAQATVPTKNVSVFNKTTRPPADIEPLAPAGLDGVSPPEPVRAPEPPRIAAREPVAVPQKQQEQPSPTLAAATAATSKEMDQPGPFHVQVGAFPDQAQAVARLESVKEALGEAMLKSHPQFIMPVSLPSGVVMYRARLSRFADEAQAKSACQKLQLSGIECWGIRAQ